MPPPHGPKIASTTKLTPLASAFVLPARAVLAIGLSGVGILSILPAMAGLWASWHDGSVEPVGMLVAVIGVLLVLRVWHLLRWEMQGTWWGLGLLLVTVAGVHLREQVLLELVAGTRAMSIPPAGLVVLAYVVGVVLLFGGPLLLRRAMFPVVLMAFVEPVPGLLGRVLEFRLFHLAVLVAYSVAHLLRQDLTPDFARFLTPQDSGLRGALTMGLLALVAGYLYRFRPRLCVSVTLCGILLGVVFHLVRLALLVAYSAVAQHVPSLRGHLATAGYLLGLGLFFAATTTLFWVVQRCSPTHDVKPPSLPVEGTVALRQTTSSFAVRWSMLVLLVAVGSVSSARSLVHRREAPAAFPQQIGTYTLSREWDENLATGPILLHWADYTSATGGPLISIGTSPILRPEETMRTMGARREGRLWRGGVSLGVTPFEGSFFADGVTQSLEASTVCDETTCGVHTSAGGHLLYSHPNIRALLAQMPSRPLSIVLRAETLDTQMPLSQAREELTETLRQFCGSEPISRFAAPYRR